MAAAGYQRRATWSPTYGTPHRYHSVVHYELVSAWMFHPTKPNEMEDALAKTDYVLVPTLRALKDSEESPSSEIRARVADALDLSEAERERIAPGSPYAEFKYAVAHALVRLQRYGHLEKVPTGNYRLTPSGAKLAASPRSLTLGDIKNKQSSTGPQPPVEGATVQPRTDAQPLPSGSRAFRVFAWLGGAVLAGIVLWTVWQYIKLLAVLAFLVTVFGWRHLRVRRDDG